MDLLSLSSDWILYLNNTLLDAKFILIEPNKLKLITNTTIMFDYTEKNNKIYLYIKNKLIAHIEKYNQKVLQYTEYKNGEVICNALMF